MELSGWVLLSQEQTELSERQVGMRVGHSGSSGLEVPSGNGRCHRAQGPEECLRRKWGWRRREGLELSPEGPSHFRGCPSRCPGR